MNNTLHSEIRSSMATPEGTKKYFEKFAGKMTRDVIRSFGKTGLSVSSIGFGGYRIHHSVQEHAEALVLALQNGVNVIDTSSNYTDGGSEILIGHALREMQKRKLITREEVVVISKVGYIQGQNLVEAKKREDSGEPFPEVVKYMEGCWHCLHPDFLEHQLAKTLVRLELDHLDIYLLHNPEYFLSEAKNRKVKDIEKTRDEYYRRIQAAFTWMEQKVKEGKIKHYGVSSNTFPKDSADIEFTSLEKVIEAAQQISKKNHFSVIQFPFNLYEKGACLQKNQENNTKTLLETANENNIATLVNRPLNAMNGNSMARLASFPWTNPDLIKESFEISTEKLKEHEETFQEKLIDSMPPEIPQENIKKVFTLAGQLSNAFTMFENWSHWDHVKQNVVFPQIHSYLNYLNEKLKEDENWQTWAVSYYEAVIEFTDAISMHYDNMQQDESQKISVKLDKLEPDLKTTNTLSQKALRILASVEGVDCVLLGMREKKYVQDAVAMYAELNIKSAKKIFEKFN